MNKLFILYVFDTINVITLSVFPINKILLKRLSNLIDMEKSITISKFLYNLKV